MSNDNRYPSTFEGIVHLVERLRGPDGCPWDREQTHESLNRLLIEECYELVEAIEAGDADRMAEELGDVLIHLVLQLQIAREADEFSAETVFGALINKLVRRHPHVFGDEEVRDSREQTIRWEELKRDERKKAGTSTLDGVPRNMPALYYAQAIQERAARAGFDWEDTGGVIGKVAEELAELEEAASQPDRERELGDVLFSVVNYGRWLGVDVEATLRRANARFYERYVVMERLSEERGLSFPNLSMDEKECLWQEAKGLES